MAEEVTEPAPRRRDADATRRRLLRAARRRFTVLGYERTTTRDIAADAEVNVSMIKRYFGSKENLYVEVVNEVAKFLDGQAAEDSGDELPEDQALLESLMGGLRADAWAEYGHVHPWMLVLRQAGADPVTDRLRRHSLLAGIAAVERSVVSPDIEAPKSRRVRAEMLIALYTGLVILREMLPEDLLATADEAGVLEEVMNLTRDLADRPADWPPSS
ncbi:MULTISPECIES: TetR/AcrR family transcriptional regulator [unclassified Streptomyces]|uniref:TetR/AcrR family transcriptional regulator n=1 Tax=unclassified Streptomyces TaxID=2593676 RepID=UPI0036E00BE3